jgi:hypothetical protein
VKSYRSGQIFGHGCQKAEVVAVGHSRTSFKDLTESSFRKKIRKEGRQLPRPPSSVRLA